MVEVKMGGVYEAALVKSGKSSLGEWKFIILKESKGRKEISIWVDPSTPIEEGGNFKVEKITLVRYSARKDQRGEWQNTVNVHAVIAPSAPTQGAESRKFVNVDVGDDELPF